MANPSYRTRDEWFALIREARKSGMTDAQWCLANGMHAMADETPVQVLKEPGRRPQAKSYMWVFRTGEFDKEQIVLFHYSPTRAGDTAKEFLEGFTGYLMTDGYSGYNKMKDCTRTSCWAHIRRYLIEAIPKGKEYDYTQQVVQRLAYVNKLFDMERFIHARKNVTFDDIREYRIEKETPLLDVSLHGSTHRPQSKTPVLIKLLTTSVTGSLILPTISRMATVSTTIQAIEAVKFS